MLSRPHPSHGWLHLQPADWRATLQRQVEERDRLDDPNHSGPAPAFIRWVDEQQMPQLAQHPHYQQQFRDRVDERRRTLALLEQQHERGRLDLIPDAEAVRLEIKQLEALIHG
jgi:hypothetical protein